MAENLLTMKAADNAPTATQVASARGATDPGAKPGARAHPADDPAALAALRADAQARLVELDGLIQRLAPDALSGDQEVVQELLALRSERDAAAAMIETVDLAQVELEERKATADAEARRQARETAYQRCVALHPTLVKAADRVNRLCGELAEAILQCQQTAQRMSAEGTAAGIKIRVPSASNFTAALASAIDQHQVRSLLELGPVAPQHRKPLRVPDRPQRPAERTGAPERPRAAAHAEVEIASGPAGYYKSLRRLGTTLETAVNEVRHSFGEAASVEILQRAEDELLEAETAETAVAA